MDGWHARRRRACSDIEHVRASPGHATRRWSRLNRWTENPFTVPRQVPRIPMHIGTRHSVVVLLVKHGISVIHKSFIAVLVTAGLALVGLGVVSLWVEIGWAGRIHQRHWARVRIEEGNLQFAYARSTEVAYPRGGLTLSRGALGVLSFRTGSSRNWRWAALSVPLWLIVALLFIHPTIAFLRGPVLRRRRLRRNQCPGCGYALAGNVSGRCPECGMYLSTDVTHTGRSDILRAANQDQSEA